MGIRLQVYLSDELESAVSQRLVRDGESPSERIREIVMAALDTGAADPVAYLSDLIGEANKRWRSAYGLLRRLKWSIPAIKAACVALDGHWGMHTEILPGVVAMELHDAERLRATASGAGVDPEEWTRLIQGLVIPEGADQARVVRARAQAEALVTLSREWWRRNGELERLLGGAPAPAEAKS